ncbi:hypothetical protein [Haloarcula sediminis]|uniref:hypothetical protein n=1 Tax=Haloarcula sediminis TaxID=3111777 RepID=UPI002D774AC6|nr:hypothetical protein [Haloarcula sp. CK38]
MSQKQSTAKQNTQQKLRAELTDFEQRYQPEKLQGLSVNALRRKRKCARAEAAGIIDSYPPEGGLTGPWRGIAHGDTDESLDALTEQQQLEVIHTLDRCIDNIDKVGTKRKDKRRAERWGRINQALQSVSKIIAALLKRP